MTDEQMADAGGEEQLRRTPPDRVVFIGQKVEINGAQFVVRKITKKDVILRGVPERIMGTGKKTQAPEAEDKKDLATE